MIHLSNSLFICKTQFQEFSLRNSNVITICFNVKIICLLIASTSFLLLSYITSENPPQWCQLDISVLLMCGTLCQESLSAMCWAMQGLYLLLRSHIISQCLTIFFSDDAISCFLDTPELGTQHLPNLSVQFAHYLISRILAYLSADYHKRGRLQFIIFKYGFLAIKMVNITMV